MKLSVRLRQEFLKLFGSGVFTLEEVKDWLRPFQCFDPEKAKDQELSKQAKKLIASVRDKSGIRECFGAKVDETHLYAFTNRTKDSEILDAQEIQLTTKRDGLNRSINKVRKRRAIVQTRLTIFDGLEDVDITHFDG